MSIFSILSGHHSKDEENVAMLVETHKEVDKIWDEAFPHNGQNMYSKHYDVAGKSVLVFFYKFGPDYSLQIMTHSREALPDTFLLGQPVKELNYNICANPEHNSVRGTKSENDQIVELSLHNCRPAFLHEMEGFKTKGLSTVRQLFLK